MQQTIWCSYPVALTAAVRGLLPDLMIHAIAALYTNLTADIDLLTMTGSHGEVARSSTMQSRHCLEEQHQVSFYAHLLAPIHCVICILSNRVAATHKPRRRGHTCRKNGPSFKASSTVMGSQV